VPAAARMIVMRLPRPSHERIDADRLHDRGRAALFAIVNAAVQMNRLSNRSEQLVIHGSRAPATIRACSRDRALERTARLYQIIGNTELLDVYTAIRWLVGTVNDLLALPLDAASQETHAPCSRRRTGSRRVEEHPTELAAYGGDNQRLSAFVDMASGVSNRISAHIDKELTSLQLAARWRSKVVPHTLLLVP